MYIFDAIAYRGEAKLNNFLNFPPLNCEDNIASINRHLYYFVANSDWLLALCCSEIIRFGIH